MDMQNKRLIGIVSAIGLLLLTLSVVDRFSDGMDWSPFDFGVAGALLLGTGLMCELVLRKVKEFKHRVALCAVILAGLFIVWAELAVGVFGTPFGGS